MACFEHLHDITKSIILQKWTKHAENTLSSISEHEILKRTFLKTLHNQVNHLYKDVWQLKAVFPLSKSENGRTKN